MALEVSQQWMPFFRRPPVFKDCIRFPIRILSVRNFVSWIVTMFIFSIQPVRVESLVHEVCTNIVHSYIQESSPVPVSVLAFLIKTFRSVSSGFFAIWWCQEKLPNLRFLEDNMVSSTHFYGHFRLPTVTMRRWRFGFACHFLNPLQ